MTMVVEETGSRLARTHEALAILATTFETKREAVPTIAVSAEAPSSSEGLALMSAYLKIADPRLRQAVLDIVATAAVATR